MELQKNHQIWQKYWKNPASSCAQPITFGFQVPESITILYHHICYPSTIQKQQSKLLIHCRIVESDLKKICTRFIEQPCPNCHILQNIFEFGASHPYELKKILYNSVLHIINMAISNHKQRPFFSSTMLQTRKDLVILDNSTRFVR